MIHAGTNGFLDRVPTREVRTYEAELYRFLETRHPGVLTTVAEKRTLDDALKAAIDQALKEFTKEFETRAAAAV
jgi:F-type H+-transporting ATPase subunit alpha